MLHTESTNDNASATSKDESSPASRLIDGRITELTDWRGPVLAQIRSIILKADPDVEEDWKWRGVPVWSNHGIICTGETYKFVVKMTFPHGAALEDPNSLFNTSLEGNTRRAIDIHEGEEIDEAALTALVQAAIAFNKEKGARKTKR